MSNAIIIRVGASLKENAGLSPLFEDNSFEYIPGLLEEDFNTSKHHNHRHYSSLNCQNENLSGMHMSSFVNEGTAHVDPEFYSFTYGESNKSRIAQLKKMKNEGIIIFCSFLQKYKLKNDVYVLSGAPHLYIIGYFTVRNIQFDTKEFLGKLQDEEILGYIATCNEHVVYRSRHVQTPQKKSLFLVKGAPDKSALFQKPLKFAIGEQPAQKFVDSWGMNPSEIKSRGVWCQNYEKVKRALEKHTQENRWTQWGIP